jgi:hypothetical protein
LAPLPSPDPHLIPHWSGQGFALTGSYISNRFLAHGLLFTLMMEAARTSETLVIFYQTAQHYKAEDSHLRTHRRENPKSYIYVISQ